MGAPEELVISFYRRVGRGGMALAVDEEVQLLVKHLKRIAGVEESDTETRVSVKFKTLFDDESVQDVFEALVGTLRAAKKRKVIAYEGEMLLRGMSDDVDIVLLS